MSPGAETVWRENNMNYASLIDKLRGLPDDAEAKFSFSAGILLCGRIERFIRLLNSSG